MILDLALGSVSTHSSRSSQTNIAQNNNKFYVIQILAPNSGAGGYVCFQRWGRVGESGQNVKRPFPSIDGAKGEFMKKV